ncbi:hypothetical protein OZ656_07200 [Marinobacter sp. LM1]|jgi:hypothetical protein|uniref:hypothetical protein n=1 Tax=Marinobacter sp. LM1 TaxID=3003349 RepID=UPI0036D37B02|tara:strand:- start:3091 stop:4842 length:1752 start_codon:yes stop_codon:yes gene_type:complete
MPIAKLITDLVAQANETQPSILIERALTLDALIPEAEKLEPYTSAECYAIKCITNNDYNFSDNGQISLAFRPHGKLHILPRKEFEAHSDFLTLFGHVELSENEVNSYLELRRSEQNALENDRIAILEYLSSNSLEDVCRQLIELSEHMAPLIYYVGKHCISNFYNIGKSGFGLEISLKEALNEVIEKREKSSIEFLTLAYCLHLLLQSGSYTRLEEANSSQLSRMSIEKFFNAKFDFYQKSHAIPEKMNRYSLFSSLPLGEKAEMIAEIRKAIEVSDNRFARHINGVNLRKNEITLPTAPVRANATLGFATPSARTIALLQPFFGPNISVEQAFLPTAFRKMLDQVSGSQESPFSSRFESLIDFVVREALLHTQSDFGMTRGTRDFSEFSRAVCQGEAGLVCEWGQANYFCHVVPSDEMKAAYAPKTLSMILNAISGRMRFNSWHYAPSYFNVDSIPAARGWFYAPRLADIADHSDQHHSGHVHATVRYSIRSPLPVSVRETVLPGFIDLRLMRQSGDPYSREDLLTAIAYTEALQFLYQSLMNFVLKEENIFLFSFGDKKWFSEVYPVKKPEAVKSMDLAEV